VAAQSASLLTDQLGFVLLRGCSVRLLRTNDDAKSWHLVKQWGSATTC
jgi:hypothetical protein